MKRQIILVKGSGSQLGNQLVLLSNFIAYCKQNGLELCYYGFEKYFAHFRLPGTVSCVRLKSSNKSGIFFNLVAGLLTYKRITLLLKFPFFRRVFYSEGKLIERRSLFSGTLATHLLLGPDHSCDLDNENIPFMVQAKRANVIFFEGWKLRAHESFDAEQDLIRELFQPLDIYSANVRVLLNRYRAEGDMLIGVHVRLGDYKTHLNGRYYYEMGVYREKMKDLAKQFSGKKLCFLLCSNEPIDEAQFKEFKTVRPSGHFIEDLYLLAGCDRIIGPPSSYSAWASFYGKVPLAFIVHPQESLKSTDFQIFGQKQFLWFDTLDKV